MSITSRRRWPASAVPIASTDASSALTPSVPASEGVTRSGSRSGASACHVRPSGNSSAASAAAWSARRVLPLPPGPVRVTSRARLASSLAISATSALRPMKGVAGTGRFERWIVRSGGKSPLSELVQADRLGEVLQALLAEVVQG